MSTSITNLRRLALRDIEDHTAIFDLYVTLGRDIEYLCIKFGFNPDELINLLEGYGEKIMVNGEIDTSGKGRLKGLPRILVEEYIQHFYPGIASENPQNDWITIEGYLDYMQPHWRGLNAKATQADSNIKSRKKVRNNFKLY